MDIATDVPEIHISQILYEYQEKKLNNLPELNHTCSTVCITQILINFKFHRNCWWSYILYTIEAKNICRLYWKSCTASSRCSWYRASRWNRWSRWCRWGIYIMLNLAKFYLVEYIVKIKLKHTALKKVFFASSNSVSD